MGINIDTNEKIAIKTNTIKNNSIIESNTVDRELEIIKIIKQHPHDNIVKFYDIINNSNNVCIIMELCTGGDMHSLMIKPFNEKHCVHYYKQIIAGLIHLHTLNIVHRDIKPHNILLTEDYHNIKLCDFGFSRQLNGIQRINTMCGSPLYMAPEILNKMDYTHKIDIWSSGIILYEMFFGTHPFGGLKDIDAIAIILNNNFIDIPNNDSNINELSDEAYSLINKVLAYDKHKRFNLHDIINHSWLETYTDDISTNLTQIFYKPSTAFSISSSKSSPIMTCDKIDPRVIMSTDINILEVSNNTSKSLELSYFELEPAYSSSFITPTDI
jgi:serine/threonine protein kinase